MRAIPPLRTTSSRRLSHRALIFATRLVQRVVLGAALGCGAIANAAAGVEPTTRPDVEQLLEAMEFERVADDLVAGMRRQSDTELAGQMQLGNLSPERVERMRALFAETYTRERLVEAMVRSFSERLTPEDTASLAARYRTPFGQRQLDAERTHDLGTDEGKFETFMQTFPTRRDSGERMAMTGAIVESRDLAGSMAGVVIDMQIAALVSLGSSLHAMTPSDLAPLVEQARAQQPVLAAQFGQLMPSVLAWTYEDMTLEELAAIRDESALPLKAREATAVIEGFRAGLVSANLAFADALSAYLRVAEASGEA